MNSISPNLPAPGLPLPAVAPFPMVRPVNAQDRELSAAAVFATSSVGLVASALATTGALAPPPARNAPKLISTAMFGIVLSGIALSVWSQGRARIFDVAPPTPQGHAQRRFRNAMVVSSVVGIGALSTGLGGALIGKDSTPVAALLGVSMGLTLVTLAITGYAYREAGHT